MGQKLNSAKSIIWGFNQIARKTIRALFPEMTLALEVEVLGVMIYTSKRDAFHFPSQKLHKILTDAKNIAALPLPVATKAHLVAAKVIPQCTYGAAISKIPKKGIARIQNEVTNVLWQNRPMWRSKWLVLGFLGQPHRVEPVLARAYSTVVSFVPSTQTQLF